MMTDLPLWLTFKSATGTAAELLLLVTTILTTVGYNLVSLLGQRAMWCTLFLHYLQVLNLTEHAFTSNTFMLLRQVSQLPKYINMLILVEQSG